jgi:sugar phosphate isomerase/epimerase
MEKQLNRRNFIGTGLTGAIAMNMGAASLASAKKDKVKKTSCKIGLILYTLRDYLKTPDDIARTLEKVKKIGYDCVEITSCEAVSPTKLSKILKQNELQAVSAHTGWGGISGDIQAVVDQNKAIGNSHVVVSSMPGEFRNGEGYMKFAKLMSEAGAKLAEADMTLGYHNHSFEFIKYNGRTGQEILITESDPKLFNFEIDTYWVQHGGADPASFINQVAGRAPTVHMKDMVMTDKGQVYAEVGEGNLNWPAILKACKKAKAQYCIVEQDSCQRDPFESVAMSIRNMKSWGLS